MSVRGRTDRLAFAASFEEIYHFRLLYSGTTFTFPILGAVRMAYEGEGHIAPYTLFQRRESGGAESYDPRGAFPGRPPTAGEITQLVPKAVQPLEGATPAGDDGGLSIADSSSRAPAAPASATDKFAAPSWD